MTYINIYIHKNIHFYHNKILPCSSSLQAVPNRQVFSLSPSGGLLQKILGSGSSLNRSVETVGLKIAKKNQKQMSQCFLAVQNSSITDIVCPLVPWSQLTIRAQGASERDPRHQQTLIDTDYDDYHDYRDSDLYLGYTS